MGISRCPALVGDPYLGIDELPMAEFQAAGDRTDLLDLIVGHPAIGIGHNEQYVQEPGSLVGRRGRELFRELASASQSFRANHFRHDEPAAAEIAHEPPESAVRVAGERREDERRREAHLSPSRSGLWLGILNPQSSIFRLNSFIAQNSKKLGGGGGARRPLRHIDDLDFDSTTAERKCQQVPHGDFPARPHGAPVERDGSIVTELFGERPPLDEPRLLEKNIDAQKDSR